MKAEKINVDSLLLDIKTYKDLKHLIDLYDRGDPSEWVIEMHHTHLCALGAINDYSAPPISNIEIIKFCIDKLRIRLKELEKKLEPFEISK
jgi:hypothetical protein